MLQITPLANDIGALVGGLSLEEPPSRDDAQQIDEAWARYHALVFRDQAGLSIEAQVVLVSRFTEVIEERMPGDQHSFVTNEAAYGTDDMNDGYREGRLTPHMDYTYTPYPADVISLYAVAIPAAGTSTDFYSNVAPLRRMPPALRERLDELTIFCAHDLATMKPDVELCREERTNPEAPTQSQTWPLVRRHPRKPGVDHLMCTLQQTERIIELSSEEDSDSESRSLLESIFEQYLYVPGNHYEHVWRTNDLVVWDNHALQHGRAACPANVGARTFRRVAGCEAGNGVQATVDFLGLSGASEAYS